MSNNTSFWSSNRPEPITNQNQDKTKCNGKKAFNPQAIARIYLKDYI